jgi:hypothetical protein
MHCVNLSITFTFNYLQVAGDCQTTTKYVEAEILAGDFAGEEITAVHPLNQGCVDCRSLKVVIGPVLASVRKRQLNPATKRVQTTIRNFVMDALRLGL